ncbi:MAG: HAD-IIIA family hydrolase [bacterium]
MTVTKSRKAALLDRDGTINVDTHFLHDVNDVALLPGAATAIKQLAAAGYPAFVFTNQSGIARGVISLAAYHAVRERIDELLSIEGAVIVDTFTCPHHPDVLGPCACRKPGLELFERAATMYDLDLSQCVYAGDRMRDVEPALVYGGKGALVVSHHTTEEQIIEARNAGLPVVPSLIDAVPLLLGSSA